MDEIQEGGDDAPRFMVLYCAIMILLLAFFIILQSLASTQEAGLFHAGRGSFVRALKTFGLGRFFAAYGVSGRGGIGARYELERDTGGRGRLARDPEMEAARGALKRLERELDISQIGRGKWAATVFAPIRDGGKGVSLSRHQKVFFRLFARRALPELLAHQSVVGIGALYRAEEGTGVAGAVRRMEMARSARRQVLESVSPGLRREARRSVYSFCRADRSDSATEDVRLHVEVSNLKQQEDNSDQ